MVGHQCVRTAEPGAEVRDTHPRLMLEDRPGAWAGGIGEEHEHAEPQRVSDGSKAAKDVFSSGRGHHARS